MEESERAALMSRIEDAVRHRMRDRKRRLAHTLGVADTAERLALEYGADPFLARAAGLLHDWDKVLSDEELTARAASYGVRVDGSLSDCVHLLHGPVAACELPHLFPELDASVFQAVARHTVGAVDMTLSARSRSRSSSLPALPRPSIFSCASAATSIRTR